MRVSPSKVGVKIIMNQTQPTQTRLPWGSYNISNIYNETLSDNIGGSLITLDSHDTVSFSDSWNDDEDETNEHEREDQEDSSANESDSEGCETQATVTDEQGAKLSLLRMREPLIIEGKTVPRSKPVHDATSFLRKIRSTGAALDDEVQDDRHHKQSFTNNVSTAGPSPSARRKPIYSLHTDTSKDGNDRDQGARVPYEGNKSLGTDNEEVPLSIGLHGVRILEC